MRLKNKVSLITGAGSGIGLSTAILFAENGSDLAISDISKTRLQSTLNNLKDYRIKTTSLAGDISSSKFTNELVNQSIKDLGKIDIVVNSAGITSRNAFSNSANQDEIWDRVIEVNLKGTYLVSTHAVEKMKDSGGGSIVNLASIMGIVGYPMGIGGGNNPYPPSKGGIIQLTKNMAIDFAKYNIRVNCLCPGFIETDLTKSLIEDPKIKSQLENLHPIGRLGKAEEEAYAALYLASDESSYVTGTSLVIDGGYTAQ